MYYIRHFVIFALFSVLSYGYDQSKYEITNEEKDIIAIQISDSDTYIINELISASDGDLVDVKLYYETLCPKCIKFDKGQFSKAVEKLNPYVDFHVYPYGNAKTVKNNGSIEFKCQHGPPECYGNKLHACTMAVLQNVTEAVLFNACMMGGADGGSNDVAADKCAASFGIDSTPIKDCAKGDRGTELLEYYGEESKKANFSHVPHILINGAVSDGMHFMRDICGAFVAPPPPCVEYSVLLVD